MNARHLRRTVLAIPGSLRRDSWNRKLLEAARALVPEYLELPTFGDLGSIPPFDEDLEADEPESVRSFRRTVEAANGLLIATPEYNQSIPGVLKNAVDWLSRPNGASCLDHKPVAVIGATPGAWGTRIAQKELRHTLWATGALLMPEPPLYVARVEARFDASGGLVDESTRQALAELLSAFASFIRWTERRDEAE